MRSMEQIVRPGIGVGPVILGQTEDAVRDLLGHPAEFEVIDYGDGEENHQLRYPSLGLDLTFAEEDSYRLGSICSESVQALLCGQGIIGLLEAEALRVAEGLLGTSLRDR